MVSFLICYVGRGQRNCNRSRMDEIIEAERDSDINDHRKPPQKRKRKSKHKERVAESDEDDNNFIASSSGDDTSSSDDDVEIMNKEVC